MFLPCHRTNLIFNHIMSSTYRALCMHVSVYHRVLPSPHVFFSTDVLGARVGSGGRTGRVSGRVRPSDPLGLRIFPLCGPNQRPNQSLVLKTNIGAYWHASTLAFYDFAETTCSFAFTREAESEAARSINMYFVIETFEKIKGNQMSVKMR